MVVVVASLLAGIMILSEGSREEGGYKLYRSSQYGFSIRYPRNWRENTVSGTAIYCDAPGHQASFNVQIPTSPGGMTLSQLVSLARLTIENMYSSWGLTITGEKDVRVNGMDGHEWKLFFENFGGMNVKATVKQDLFIVNELLYTITFVSTTEFYDQYAETFDNILNSFTVP
jgi:hypothetical protein